MLSALPPPLVPVAEVVVPDALVVGVDVSLPFAFLLLPVYDAAWTPVPLVQVPGLALDEKVMSAHYGKQSASHQNSRETINCNLTTKFQEERASD